MDAAAEPDFVPASLSRRIDEALAAAHGDPAAPATKLRAAAACLQQALALGDDRRAALDLLAADALLTSACEAAAGSGSPPLATFAADAASVLAGLAEEDGP